MNATAARTPPIARVASKPKSANWGGLASSLALPVAAISMVFVMLVPLPAFVLDVLLAGSITASLLVFLAALQLQKAVEFSVFPTMLLLLTLLRLSLNLASSRRILLHGAEGTAAAGNVIEAFGQFVVGGNFVVGFVLFLALIAIQFLVVSHGAVRTAEVTARFTLDALPGKQMAIDADLNAGLINEAAARKRREAIAREAEFYGAMDGAARFTQRDALATILITAINIVAGLCIGVLQQGMPLADALRTYTILTVGDGLVTMIPSLLVSVAGGIVLTRASAETPLGGELKKQLLNRATSLYVAAVVVLLLALVPGMPKIAFAIVAAGLVVTGRAISRSKATSEPGADAQKQQSTARTQSDNLAAALKVEELALEIGFQLIPLVDEKQSAPLLQRVRALRRHMATQLGFLLPSVHITDNLRLRPREYVVLLRGIEIGRWELEGGGALLAVSNDANPRALAGKAAIEPAFHVPARWIAPQLENEALAAGYSVVDQSTVIATHLGELMRRHAHELLGRAETKRLLDSVNDSHPKLVEELVPKTLSMGETQRVLQQLLREGVSIRDLGAILEALVETAQVTKALPVLVEAARQSLGRALVQPYLDGDGGLRVFALSPELEDEVVRAVEGDTGSRQLGDGARTPARADFLRRVVEAVSPLIQDVSSSATPVLLCQSPARYFLRRWLEPFVPRLAVVSPAEVPPGVQMRAAGVLS